MRSTAYRRSDAMARARHTGYLSLALLATAALFELPTLYVPAIALGLVVLGTLAWVEVAARGARMRTFPGPPTIEEGRPYPLRLRLDWGRVPPPAGELSHPGLRDPAPVGRGFQPEVVAELRFSRWGPQEIEPATLLVRDPLHLHRRVVEGDPGQRVLVLPRTEPVLAPAEGNGGAPGLSSGGVGTRSSGRAGQPIEPEIDGLRPWRPGTPASRIHWPSLARTGELLERGVTGGGDSSPLVVLDRCRGADPESLLRAVRAAASLCLHLARSGGCSLLLPGESRVLTIDRRLRSWPQVHARLAFVVPGLPVRADPPSDATTIFWVSPRGGGEPGEWGRSGNRDSYLVTPAEIPGVLPAFRVAGCRGYPLASATRAVAAAGHRPEPARRW
jgi:uncharacterized protein (DUF58 family)